VRGAVLGHREPGAPGHAADLPEEFADLADRLGDLYFSNFSLFQSLIDSWGIDQIFPIIPIHRLDERPTRRGTLADITCDSDGRVDQFPGRMGPNKRSRSTSSGRWQAATARRSATSRITWAPS
jgi:hypothetical protein